jgi:uncharacterized membrane protein YczE
VSQIKRYVLFIFGIFFMSLGISCVIKSTLGTSPISSVPFVLSLHFPLSVGETTFILNMGFLLGQIVVLGRRFQLLQLLQIPITVIFGFFIDLTMAMLHTVVPNHYAEQFVLMLAGATLVALGVALQIIGNVVTLAGEGFVKAIAVRWRYNFGTVKTCFDTSLVILAILLSWSYFGAVRGIREGTLISALITGSISRFFIHYLSYRNGQGEPVFHLPFLGFASTAEGTDEGE